MSTKNSSFRKLFSRATALMGKIENSALDDAEVGYVKNDFGSYDSKKLVDSLSALYEEMLSSEFVNDTIRFQYAGFLCRECRYEESIQIYRGLLLGANETLRRAAHLGLARCYIRTGVLLKAQEHVDIFNVMCATAGLSSMLTSIEKLMPKRDL